MKLCFTFITIIYWSIVLADTKRCEGGMSFLDDRIQLKIEYKFIGKRVNGKVTFLNTYTNTRFDLYCNDKIIKNKYFLCEPREDYLEVHLLVGLNNKTQLMRFNDKRSKGIRIGELWCNDEHIQSLIDDNRWMLD